MNRKDKLRSEEKTIEYFCFRCNRMFYWAIIDNQDYDRKLNCPVCKKKVNKGEDIYLYERS